MSFGPVFNSETFRKDHAAIIAANRHLAKIHAVQMPYNASGYSAGLVLGKQTSTGYYMAYNDAGSSGLDSAVCVLLDAIAESDFPSSTSTIVSKAIFGGELYESKLTGLDANGKTDLKSRSFTDAFGNSILSF